MNKLIHVFLLISNTLFLFSQDIIFEEDLELKSASMKELKVAYPIVDKNKGNFTLVIMDQKNIHLKFFDKDLKLQNTITGNRPKFEFQNFLGHSVENNTYHLYFANEDRDELHLKSFDSQTMQQSETIIPLQFNKERFLTSISNGNSFYILTIKKSSSLMKIYKITDGEQLIAKEHDFSNNIVRNKETSNKLDNFMFDRDIFNTTSNLQEINFDKLYTLIDACEKNKMYTQDNQLYITLDNDFQDTKLIQIDLTDLSFSLKKITKEKIKLKKMAQAVSNSCLYKNILFQVKLSDLELSLSIRDIMKDSLIKSYNCERDSAITFKNTSLIRERVAGLIWIDSIYKNTKKFLEALESGPIGLHVFPDSNSFIVLLGGYEGNDPYMFNNFHHFHHTPVSFPTPPAFPRTGWSVTSSNTLSTSTLVRSYFKSRFDMHTGEFIPGKLAETPFDKIIRFRDANRKNTTAETSLKINGYFIYGYYDKKVKKYYIRSFEDSMK